MNSTVTNPAKTVEVVDLFDDDEPQESQPKKRTIQNESLATQKREQGNALFRDGKYQEAIRIYTEAIELTPSNHFLYGNRSLAYFNLNQFDLALSDANDCIRLNQQYARGWLRKLKCHIAMGDINPARHAALKYKELQPDANDNELSVLEKLEKLVRELDKSISNDDYRSVVYYANEATKIAIQNVSFRLARAEALSHLHRYEEAQDVVNALLRLHPTNADVHYVRGVILYYQEMLDKAILHFQQARRLHPDHSKALKALTVAKNLVAYKERGNVAYKNGALDDAWNSYQEALKIDPNNKFFNAKLYFNLALVLGRKKQKEQAMEMCKKALSLDPQYLKAKMKCAQLYGEMEQYQEAVNEYEAIYKEVRSREVKTLLEEAKVALKRSKRKDYYKILSVDKNANEDELKRAYKKAAVIHHPDKHSADTVEVQKKHEQMFKDISEAYTVLSDTQKRKRYDMGYDLNETDHQEFFDPNQLFSMFYGHNGPFGNYAQFH